MMLQQLLELKDLGNNTFSSTHHQPNFRNALFGGQVVAQGLVAAGLTVKNLTPHSLHAYFLRPGKADTPVIYEVEILKDGRSVSTRAVKAIQEEKLIFTMQASFHNPENGFEHSVKPQLTKVEPDELKKQHTSELTQLIKHSSHLLGVSPLEFIPFNGDLFSNQESTEKNLQFWFKSSKPLTSETLLHYAALAFSSDLGLLGTSLLNHNGSIFTGEVTAASMDHSIWFHAQPNWNEWNRYITESPWAGGARALCKGQVFDINDTLMATVAQEGMIRLT